MPNIKAFLRKITPLRASTYEKSRKQTERQLNDISSDLKQIKAMLCQLQVNSQVNRQLAKHQESLERANRELLQLWKALPIKPLEPRNTHPQVIASFTTFPLRIEAACDVAIMLLHQTERPDRILLWLASEEFPGREADLPEKLLSLREYGVEIRWCDQNIKGHKKYYYTMQENPDDIVITFDDDLLYEADCIERLLKQHEKTPDAIVASRARVMRFDENGNPLPYKQWSLCSKENGVCRMDLLATNGAGSLFPPRCLHEEVFNIENIKALALNTDDLWLKIMSALANTATISIQRNDVLYLEGTQEQTLWQDNGAGGGNDRSFELLLVEYNNWNENSTLLEAFRSERSSSF